VCGRGVGEGFVGALVVMGGEKGERGSLSGSRGGSV